MEKIGSINNIYQKLHKSLALEAVLLEIRTLKHIEQEYQNIVFSTTETLKEIYAKGNLLDLINAEILIIKFELKNFFITKIQKASLEKALLAHKRQEKCLHFMLSQNYKHVFQFFGSKASDSKNLPKDATREFLSSHITRLYNSCKSSTLSQNETNKLEQRHRNIQRAFALYVHLQTQAKS